MAGPLRHGKPRKEHRVEQRGAHLAHAAPRVGHELPVNKYRRVEIAVRLRAETRRLVERERFSRHQDPPVDAGRGAGDIAAPVLIHGKIGGIFRQHPVDLLFRLRPGGVFLFLLHGDQHCPALPGEELRVRQRPEQRRIDLHGRPPFREGHRPVPSDHRPGRFRRTAVFPRQRGDLFLQPVPVIEDAEMRFFPAEDRLPPHGPVREETSVSSQCEEAGRFRFRIHLHAKVRERPDFPYGAVLHREGPPGQFFIFLPYESFHFAAGHAAGLHAVHRDALNDRATPGAGKRRGCRRDAQHGRRRDKQISLHFRISISRSAAFRPASFRR